MTLNLWAFCAVAVICLTVALAVFLLKDRVTDVKLPLGSRITLDKEPQAYLSQSARMLVEAEPSAPQELEASDAATSSSSETLGVAVEAAAAGIVTETPALAGASTPISEVSTPRGRDERRAQVELVMDAAAQWGWLQAKSGVFKDFPHPVIDWDNEDQPTIAYGSTDQTAIDQVQRRAGLHLAARASMSLGGSAGGPSTSSGAHLKLSGS